MSPAVTAIARFEWRRRRRGLIALALIAGLFGGVIIAGAAVARRTASAPQRLSDRVDVGDVHLQTVGDAELADVVAALPMVAGVWSSRLSVARIDGEAVRYVGVLTQHPVTPSQRSTPFTPVVVEGRTYADDAADEVVMRQDDARLLGIGVNDLLPVTFLTPEEIGQFDTGFGDPDGPSVRMRVVGLVKVPPGVLDGSPIVAGPAFAAAHPEVESGTDMFVDLVDGARSVPAFTAAVDQLMATREPSDHGEDFPAVVIDDPHQGTVALQHSSQVLIGGLVAALVVAVLAALVVCGQAWSRHFTASSAQQQIESALGLAPRSRLAARLLPSAAGAMLAALLAASIGVLGSAIQPLGGLTRIEPEGGWRFDEAAIVLGSLAVGAIVMILAALAALRSGRRDAAAHRRHTVGPWRFAPRRRGWPLAGAAFARSSGDVRRSVPVTMSLVANVIGIGGLVGAFIFAASLDRLTDTPARYGWNGDLAVMDVNDDIVADLSADGQVAAVADVLSNTIRVGTADLNAYAFTPVRGAFTWVVDHGSLPAAADQVMLGSRLADDLDVRVGDQVVAGSATFTVSGIGLGPPLNGEELGGSMLFDVDGIRRAAAVGSFREAAVRLTPGVSLNDAAAQLGTRYELTVRELPAEVRRIADLGSLPMVLGSFLAGLAAVALAHALAVTARRRARDLAVLRAIGGTPAQAGLTIVATSVVTVAIGIVVGVPVGWATARLVWGELAHSVGVRGDVRVPPAAGLAVLGALAMAVLLAAPAAIGVYRHRPGDVLHED